MSSEVACLDATAPPQLLPSRSPVSLPRLRLALERWNSVLAIVQRNLRVSREANEVMVRLGELLSSMEQHSKAIDELHAAAFIDPATKITSQLASLGVTLRHQILTSLLQQHGSGWMHDLSKMASKIASSLSRTPRERLAQEGSRRRSP